MAFCSSRKRRLVGTWFSRARAEGSAGGTATWQLLTGGAQAREERARALWDAWHGRIGLEEHDADRCTLIGLEWNHADRTRARNMESSDQQRGDYPGGFLRI